MEVAGAGFALARFGWQVALHERSPNPRMFGSDIWLWENDLKTLKLLGAYDAATARARVVKEWRIADGHGATLFSKTLQGQNC